MPNKFEIEIDAVIKSNIERISRAYVVQQKAYYDLSARDFAKITDSASEAISAVRIAADNEVNEALQMLGWHTYRRMEGKE